MSIRLFLAVNSDFLPWRIIEAAAPGRFFSSRGSSRHPVQVFPFWHEGRAGNRLYNLKAASFRIRQNVIERINSDFAPVMKLNDAFPSLVNMGDGTALIFCKTYPRLGILGSNVK